MMNRKIIIACMLAWGHNSLAQPMTAIQPADEPLVLQAVGSFYVGGEKEFQNETALGGFSSAGEVTVNQMYVNYMVPHPRTDSTSFVLIHGMNLSGKTWETTPDGQMGWSEYLVRKGYPVYWVDQVGAGRSGFNQKHYNLVREEKMAPENQQTFQRISDDNTWINFRFGLKNRQSVEQAKYPVGAADEFSKQSIPFALFGLPNPNPNYLNLARLATGLRQTVLVSHSQSGRFPLEAALLNPEGVKAMVLLEPGGSGDDYSDEQVKALAAIPLLIVFGDNLENETGIAGHSWKTYYDAWGRFIQRLNAAGGKARMLYLPDLGIAGNSHMLMQDTNNQQIADIMTDWLKDQK